MPMTVSSQLAFAFVETRLQRRRDARTNNLFFALKPPACMAAEIYGSIAAQPWAFPSDLKPLPAERLHISLAFVGSHPDPAPALVARLEDQVEGIAFPAIDIAFERVASFGGNAVVLFGGGCASRIGELRRELLRRLSLTAKAAFEPHMTLFYSPIRVADYPIKPAGWTATEVVLIHSNRGHRTLARWPLGTGTNGRPVTADRLPDSSKPICLA